MSDTFSVLVANHGIQADILNASEQIRLNHRILSGQVCNQLFDIIPLGSARAAAAQAVFREAAGTLNEVQFIGISPGLDSKCWLFSLGIIVSTFPAYSMPIRIVSMTSS